MELCEDLIQRIEMYGISQYFDAQSLLKRLEQNWKVQVNQDKNLETQILYFNGHFNRIMASFFSTVSDFLYKFGIVGTVQASMAKWALGYAYIHPGYFITALIGSAGLKVGSDQLRIHAIMQHLDILTDHFAMVTSNLMNDYTVCSEIVSNSFTDKNHEKVH